MPSPEPHVVPSTPPHKKARSLATSTLSDAFKDHLANYLTDEAEQQVANRRASKALSCREVINTNLILKTWQGKLHKIQADPLLSQKGKSPHPVASFPMSVTGKLPHPLGKTITCLATHTEWYETCNINNPKFMEQHKLAEATPAKHCTCDQHAVINHVLCESKESQLPAFIAHLDLPPML